MEHQSMTGRRSRRRQRFMQSPLPVLLACAGIGVLAWGNVRLLDNYPAVMAWLPAGAGLGLSLLLGPRMVAALVIGTAAGMASAGIPIGAACFAALWGGAACLLCWALLVTVRPLPLDRLSVPQMARMALTAALVYGLTAGAAAWLAAHAGGRAPLPAPDASLAWRLLSDALGVMLVAPALIWLAQPRSLAAGPQWLAALFTFALLGAVTLLVYGGTLANRLGLADSSLLVLPPALWLALRYGTGFTMAGNLMLVLAAGVGTSRGYGPFAADAGGLPLTLTVMTLTALLVAASRAECRHAEATLQKLATHDGLTGVANRRAFSERMEQVLDTAARDGRAVALMFIDLTHFKHVNDRLGRQVGDMLLAEAARRMLGCIRSDSMLGRFGDDEFVVMVDDASNRDALGGIATRIAEAVSRPYAISGHACQIGCALGISVFPRDGVSVAELVRKADAAMYQLKSDGAHGYRFYAAAREPEQTSEAVS